MSTSKRSKRRRNKRKNKNIAPYQERSSTIATVTNKNGKFKKIKNPVHNYGFREYFAPAEYNLAEIAAIEDGESYVRQAFQKKTALMFKEGESFTGKNQDTIKYLKRRIREMEYVTGKPWRDLLRETGYALISRSNYFWVKVRSNNSSSGKRPGDKPPIAGYFGMPPETVRIKKDKNGKIKKYRQEMPDGRWKEFSPDEVIHFTAYKKPGFLFGTPQIVPVIEDIHALRRLEEHIEIMMHQTLFPIFQYTVGTDQAPAGKVTLPDGTVMDEVEYVRQQVSVMPTEGGFVTPERHKIDYIGAQGEIPNYKNALDYFKQRVLAGLGISSLDIGDGDTSTRSTADSLSKAMVDSVKDFQDIFQETINSKVIPELLLEGMFSFDALEEENFVMMEFKEIDIEEQLKKNVNAQLLYNSDMIDLDEGREITGREPLRPEQEPLMFTERQTLRVLEEEANFAESLATTQAKLAPKADGSKSTAASKSGSNSSRPTNQYGTKTGPQRSRKDRLIRNETRLLEAAVDIFDEETFNSLVESARQRLYKKHDQLGETISEESWRDLVDLQLNKL